ncbi:PadR family transcriptional regulator [Streptomyces sp. NPDC051322]|uniref:PadR family transcriptional regulator n=1 Tax=Streptomyces sp. NPDC051322 TaxID=3154645 RepID=UPI003450DC32
MRSHGHGNDGPGHRGRGDFEGRRGAFGPFGPPFGGPFGGRGGRGGPRGRARRGDVRASILALLKDRPMHGYEMIQEIGERSGGAWRPSPGSVYPTLQLLEDEGLITSASEGGKKLFTLTGSGRTAADEGPEAPWEAAGRGGDWDTINEIRQEGFGVMEAFGQVWRTGTPEQRQKAIALIGETKKKLYLILADEA